MPQGKITKLVSDRGFGFIAGERGEVFFHHSSVADAGFDNLQEGQSVQYELESEGGGRGKGPSRPRSSRPDAPPAEEHTRGAIQPARRRTPTS